MPFLLTLFHLVTSKEFEVELENENEENSRRAKEAEDLCERLQKEFDKLSEKYNKEVRAVEKENELLKRSLLDSGDQAKLNQQKLVNLEIDNEDYERQLR